MSLPNTTLTAAYEAMTPGSARLAEKARGLFPSGLTHDSRHFDPYPIYVTHGQGPVKWDVDGNRYVDYFGGHGCADPGPSAIRSVTAAVHAAYDRGTHFGACTRGGNPLGRTDHRKWFRQPNGCVSRTPAPRRR